MAFKKQDPVTRNPQIRELEITLFRTTDADNPKGPESVRFGVIIADQFGQPMNALSGNLVPHLSSGQISALQGFMDAMWAKAESEVIG